MRLHFIVNESVKQVLGIKYFMGDYVSHEAAICVI